MKEYKKGDKINVEIDHISDGRGVAKGDNEEVIIVEGVNDTDDEVKVEVLNVLEETILTKKLSKIGGTTQPEEEAGESPYEVDSDEDKYDEDGE